MRVRIAEWREFELSEDQMKQAAEAVLRRLVYPGEYLRTDKDGVVWLKKDEPEWRHGSVAEDVVRKATEDDIAVFRVLDLLRSKK